MSDLPDRIWVSAMIIDGATWIRADSLPTEPELIAWLDEWMDDHYRAKPWEIAAAILARIKGETK
jgi:hypothetical protein